MKYLFFILVLLFPGIALHAQKETYDIVSYSAPSGWKKETGDHHLALSKIDGESWGQIAIYQSTASKGDIETDIQREWEAIVLALHAVESEEKTNPETINEWTMMTRSGIWQYNGAAVATTLTTYSNGKVCISLMCNATAKAYLEDYQQLVKSITLQLPQTETGNTIPANANGTDQASIVGLWVNYNNESSGFMNGMPVLTGGYFRKEYIFYANGTYLYRAKNWSATVKEILFIYETGTYFIKGSLLTITPTQGKGGWWSKAASGRTEGWGARTKNHTHKLEKITYAFEKKYLPGMGENYLILKQKKPTVRDGRQSNNDNVLHEFNYSHLDINKSLVDDAPGTSTGLKKDKISK